MEFIPINRSCYECGGGLLQDDNHSSIECGMCRIELCEECKWEKFSLYLGEEDIAKEHGVDIWGPAICDECAE